MDKTERTILRAFIQARDVRAKALDLKTSSRRYKDMTEAVLQGVIQLAVNTNLMTLERAAQIHFLVACDRLDILLAKASEPEEVAHA
ncbi:hypothetical protein UFOVP707_11 [uncultured Caudovirales phage]|uniref:Uncharacterized protein n=1 Tax=uncultured Caudovirales phage TaxID=2100421 RepID=A0A6J5NTN2_9CAUD|nr:hypothetical protein UFOVP707_11 [uncultured Caudovirales phage]